MRFLGKNILIVTFLPFSIPFILKELRSKRKEALALVALLIGFLSFIYWPTLSSDKATYYGYYEEYSSMGFNEFLFFLTTEKADYFFHFLIYFFSIQEIPFHFLLLLITYLTVILWFKIFHKIIRNFEVSKKNYLIFISLLIFSFNYPHLLSGIRFYLAISFVAFGFFYGVVHGRNFLYGIIPIAFSSLIHFSCLIYLPVFIFLYSFRNYHKLMRYLFFTSLLLWILPKDLLFNQFTNLGLLETRQTRIDAYLGNDDIIQYGLQTFNTNYFLNYLFTNLWMYFSIVYVFINSRNNSVLRNLFYISFIVSNIFYSSPMIFDRYILLTKGIFVLLVIYENANYSKIGKLTKFASIVIILGFLVNIYVYRSSFLKGIFQFENITFPTLLLRDDYKTKDFIDNI